MLGLLYVFGECSVFDHWQVGPANHSMRQVLRLKVLETVRGAVVRTVQASVPAGTAAEMVPVVAIVKLQRDAFEESTFAGDEVMGRAVATDETEAVLEVSVEGSAQSYRTRCRALDVAAALVPSRSRQLASAGSRHLAASVFPCRKVRLRIFP